MERIYEARVYRTLGQNDHQTDWVRERVSTYSSDSRADLLGWVISMVSEHGMHGDETIDWVEAWSNDPDDGWQLLGSADADTIQEAADQMLAEV